MTPFLVPVRWNKLALPALYRRSLKEAVEDLPAFLDRAAAIDGEVVGFTQNRGWQKMGNLVPLLYSSREWLFDQSDHWIDCMSRFTSKLKVSPVPFL